MTAALLGKALVEAQAAMPGLTKDGKNPHFRSEFVTLDNLINTTRPVLNKHGLSVQQFPTVTDLGAPALRTRLTHSSGEFIEDTMPLLLTKQDSQGLGSAITYARRYALAAILGLATETDDEGNSAGAVAAGGQEAGEAGPAPTDSYTSRIPKAKRVTQKDRDAVVAGGNKIIGSGKYSVEALQRAAGSALPWPDFIAGLEPEVFWDFAGKVERHLSNLEKLGAQEQAA